MKTPRVPMMAQHLPQQRLYLIKAIPAIPIGLPLEVGYCLHTGLKRAPRAPTYLFQAEWSWSPYHGRIHAYFLHKGQKFWTLYLSDFDDSSSTWAWSTKQAVARTPRGNLDERQAAFFLTISFLQFESQGSNLDPFHWINEYDFLSVADVKAIERVLWPK
jgi:hypothetical protein